MEKLGFEVKQGKHIAVKVPGMKRFKRLDTISEDLSGERLEAMFRYGDASLASPVNRTVSLLPVRKAVLTPYQRKCYARMYRLRQAEKKRFTYKSAYAAFEMVRTYFEKIGMDTSFDSVYEETKLLTDYYEKLKAEEFIQKQTEQINLKNMSLNVVYFCVTVAFEESNSHT